MPDLASREVLDKYIEKSWRSNAERQRSVGMDFVIGKREGAYIWNLEGTRRLIDCGVAGGVHSLGHRAPEVLEALQTALSESRDTGLWSIPNAEYLELQDLLAKIAPTPELNRSVITLASTVSVNLALMFSFRFTGRTNVVAYKHGYHGHTGLAAAVTGSEAEGIIEYYHLNHPVRFFGTFKEVDGICALLTEDVAAFICEPWDYETFEQVPPETLERIAQVCHEKGIVFIIDETRTGLGRTGRLWGIEWSKVKPDMLITGKGLSGGLYPASAVLTLEEIYERCMNEHKYAYISSLGGNEISCIVARKVLELCSQPQLLEDVRKKSELLAGKLDEVGAEYPNLIGKTRSFGLGMFVPVADDEMSRKIQLQLIVEGVLPHSISMTRDTGVKFLPPIRLDEEIIDEIAAAFQRSLEKVARD